jgi:hypothetical protein
MILGKRDAISLIRGRRLITVEVIVIQQDAMFYLIIRIKT